MALFSTAGKDLGIPIRSNPFSEHFTSISRPVIFFDHLILWMRRLQNPLKTFTIMIHFLWATVKFHNKTCFLFLFMMRTSHSQPNVIPNCKKKRRVSKPLWTTIRRISGKVRVGSRWTTRVPLPSLDLLQLEGPGKQLPVLVCYGSDHSTPNFPGILQQFSWAQGDPAIIIGFSKSEHLFLQKISSWIPTVWILLQKRESMSENLY